MARVLPTEPTAQPIVFLTCLRFGYGLSHEVRCGIFCLELVSKRLDFVVHSVVFQIREAPSVLSVCDHCYAYLEFYVNLTVALETHF